MPPISKSFVRAGKPNSSKKGTSNAKGSLFDLANDWELQIDLDGSFCWPIKDLPEIVKPDIMFVSNARKIVIWCELTSPMERRMWISATKKQKRYKTLKSALMTKGWTVYDFTFEVGALGFVSNSLSSLLLKLGFSSNQKNHMIRRMCLTARRSSFFIWNARHSLSWNPPVICSATVKLKDVKSAVNFAVSAALSAKAAASAAASASASATAAISAASSAAVAASTAAALLPRTTAPIVPLSPEKNKSAMTSVTGNPRSKSPNARLPLPVLDDTFNNEPSKVSIKKQRFKRFIPPDLVNDMDQPKSGCIVRTCYANPMYNSLARFFKAWTAPLPPHDYVSGDPAKGIRQKVWRRIDERFGVFPVFVKRV